MPNKPTQASWWIIGRDNPNQKRAVAVDLLDANSELCNPNPHNETWTMELSGPDELAGAFESAVIYAAEHGVGALDVHFDPISTEYFAKC